MTGQCSRGCDDFAFERHIDYEEDDWVTFGPLDMPALRDLRLTIERSGMAREVAMSVGHELARWIDEAELADYGMVEAAWAKLPALRKLHIVCLGDWADDVSSLSWDSDVFLDPLGELDPEEYAVSYVHFHRAVDETLRDVCAARSIMLRVRFCSVRATDHADLTRVGDVGSQARRLAQAGRLVHASTSMTAAS